MGTFEMYTLCIAKSAESEEIDLLYFDSLDAVFNKIRSMQEPEYYFTITKEVLEVPKTIH